MKELARARALWSCAARPLYKESTSGDRHLVLGTDYGLFMAVVDGLGHGPAASAAAQAAAGYFSKHAMDPNLGRLLLGCNAELAGTRGAAMTLAAYDERDRILSWLGVGNVTGVVVGRDGRREHLLPRAGIVGWQLPALAASRGRVEPGDVLVLATDGIRPEFSENLPYTMPADKLAEFILRRWAVPTDDALALVVRLP